MVNTLPYKTKQFFFVLIKLSIVAGAFYFIYQKLSQNTTLDFNLFFQLLIKNNVLSLKTVIFLLILTLFNWLLEIVKWQKLVGSFKKISLQNALEQSLGALTASLFTPNRIGEYGAKAIYFSSHQRKKIVLLNLIGNMTQMTATTLFGIMGLFFFVTKYNVAVDYYKLGRVIIIALLILAVVGFGIKNSKITIKGFSIEKIRNYVIHFPKRTLSVALLLSIFRYFIFSFQFYFLLQIFKIEIDYFNAMILVSTMYFLSSIVPSIFIFDVVIKGSIALYLFSFIEVDELTILSITTLMWLLNFVLPSLFGSYYVLNFNLPKEIK